MDNHKLIKYIQKLRDNALKSYISSENGIVTLKESEEAEEDLIANYYEDDLRFIMSRTGDICEHYIEQQEYLYYQAFLDCIELAKKYPRIIEDDDLKEKLIMLRKWDKSHIKGGFFIWKI